MILDALLEDGWKQYQNVKKIHIQISGNDEPDFKLTVWFYDEMYPKMEINLNRIDEIKLTND